MGVHTFSGLVGVEIAIGDKTHGFASLNCENADQRLVVLAMRFESTLQELPHTWTQSKRKFKLKSKPDRTYLFITVIIIDEPQYARTGRAGLLDMEGLARGARDGGGAASNSLLPWSTLFMSTV
jgi:hypothetical protein